VIAHSIEEFELHRSSLADATPLWPTLLAAGVLFAVAESVVANRPGTVAAKSGAESLRKAA
jgi:hypothetical protein